MRRKFSSIVRECFFNNPTFLQIRKNLFFFIGKFDIFEGTFEIPPGQIQTKQWKFEANDHRLQVYNRDVDNVLRIYKSTAAVAVQ